MLAAVRRDPRCRARRGIAIAMVTAPRGNDDLGRGNGSGGSADDTTEKADPRLKEAQDALFSDPVRAIQIIESNKTTLSKNCGRADGARTGTHVAKREREGARCVSRGARVSPGDAENETLRSSLRTLSGDRNVEIAVGAMDLWFGNTG